MNLYVVSSDPKECAKYIDTKRLGWVGVKESTQLIFTALNVLYNITDFPLKPTHKNHPVAKWVRAHPSNLVWTIKYMWECSLEYERRKNKIYMIKNINCFSLNFKLRKALYNNDIEAFQYEPPTTFCNYARNKDLDLDFTHIEDVHDAYKLYLAKRWTMDKRTPTWK